MLNKSAKAAFILLILAISQLTYGQETTKTSEYTCATKSTKLVCPESSVIFVSSINHKYAPDICFSDPGKLSGNTKPPRIDLNKNLSPQMIRDCVGIDQNDDRIMKECNGKRACDVRIEKKTHITGFYGTNCDFESNYAKIFYTCIPNTLRSSIKAFDICERNGPEIILGLENGFIHSPNYPTYYGNKRNCLINIGVPSGKRLIMYLLSLNLEGLSIVDGKPRDYLLIENETELYGQIDTPYIFYNRSDRERVQLKFRSDWITTTNLRTPKGFLIHFTQVTTTTEPNAITDALIRETKKLFDDDSMVESSVNLAATANHLSQKNLDVIREKNGEHTVTIISVLVGVIGVLVIVIFGLLLMFRSRPKNPNEEDHIYDVADEKSMSNIYSGGNSNDYTNTSMNKSVVTYEDKQNYKLSKTTSTTYSSPGQSTNTSAATTVSSAPSMGSRLKSLYRNLSQTLNLSNKILNEAKNLDNSSLNNTTISKNLNESTNGTAKSFNVNEFNPNDVDVKFEKDIAIDTLKLCKTSSTGSNGSIMKAFDMYKRNNLEYQQQHSLNNEVTLKRSENVYVCNPTVVTGCVSDELDEDGKSKRLQIYEVNFENNYAYLTAAAASKATATAQNNATASASETAATAAINADQMNAEIYHTINEIEEPILKKNQQEEDDYDVANAATAAKKHVNGEDAISMIYQTPTNSY